MKSSLASPLLLFFNKTKNISTKWCNSCTYQSDYEVRSFLPISNWLSDLIFSSLSLFASPILQHLIWVHSPPHQLSACLPTPALAQLSSPSQPVPVIADIKIQPKPLHLIKDAGFVTYFKLIKEICFS